MSDFAILTDSSCDLTRDLRERFGVEDYLHGFLVFPDGHQEKADLDWGNMSAERFYGGMKEKKELYTTAQPGMQDFIDLRARNRRRAGPECLHDLKLRVGKASACHMRASFALQL